MAIPAASVTAGHIVSDLGDVDPRSLAAWTAVVKRITDAVKLGTVSTTGVAPITGPAGTTPVTSSGTIA